MANCVLGRVSVSQCNKMNLDSIFILLKQQTVSAFLGTFYCFYHMLHLPSETVLVGSVFHWWIAQGRILS